MMSDSPTVGICGKLQYHPANTLDTTKGFGWARSLLVQDAWPTTTRGEAARGKVGRPSAE